MKPTVMFESIRSNRKGILLMIASSICVSVGQLLWKLSYSSGLLVLLAGFAFYGTGALVMIFAYRHGKLSVLQPILSLNYVLSIFLAAIVLKEEITLIKSIGVVIIIAGVLMIAGGDNQ